MIYKQLSYLPILFQVDEGIYLDIEKFLFRNKLRFNKILVVSGGTTSRAIAEKVVDKYCWEHLVIQSNAIGEVENLKEYSLVNKFDLLIAVGGGKVLDVVKRVSYLTNINHVSVPTTISNDGLISPISVVKDHDGRTQSLPGMMPMGVIIDLDIVSQAPIVYLRSAAGDVLSNLSSTNDWVLALENNGENINDISYHLSRSAANCIVYFEKKDLSYKPFLRQIIQGQVNSGIAMGLAGSSRPCSGSEHLISHAIDYLGYSKDVLHGTQVASTSLFTLYLQGKLLDEHIEFAKKTEIPLLFTDLLTVKEDEHIKEVLEVSKFMRPGRFTVLDLFDGKEVISKLESFKADIYEFKD